MLRKHEMVLSSPSPESRKKMNWVEKLPLAESRAEYAGPDAVLGRGSKQMSCNSAVGKLLLLS